MDHNVDIVQKVVRELASEDGLHIVRSVVQSVQSVEPDLRRNYLDTAIMPLFRILSHRQVIDSAVLEQEVGILYRCLLGIDNSRLRALFAFLFDVARDAKLGNEDPNNNSFLEPLSISAGVLAKVVDSSISNQLDTSFCNIAQQFSTIVDDVPNANANYHCIQASKYLEYIRRRLGIGKALPMKSTEPRVTVDRAHFTLTQDMPGGLSRHGRRHDNDHENIAEISLMPTVDEIMSLREEYLPTVDTTSHHLDGVQGLLDRHFRLLREDLFYDLRNAVRSELEQLMGRAPSRGPGELRTKVRTYQPTRALDVTFDPRQGLELEVQILQPQFARRLEKKQRVEAWNQSRRLSPGSLVCAVDELGTAVFFLVSPTTEITVADQRAKDHTERDPKAAKQKKMGLADDQKFSHIWLQPVEQTGAQVVEAITWFKSMVGSFNRRLLEFPGVLIPAALPPLKAIQNMYMDASLPFDDILTNPGGAGTSLRPPLYSLRPGFFFDLSCLCRDETRLHYRTLDTPDARKLSEVSTLDQTQASAILDSLRRSIAITQGPPGTGKSYTGEALIKALLANRSAAQLGPIICVCYTNHALDQLLEHLLDAGVEQIIRIGSRSKSERLAKVNLREVASSTTRTRMEGRRLFESWNDVDNNSQLISNRLKTVKFAKTEDLIKAHLAENYPEWHLELFGGVEEDEDGFHMVAKKKNNVLKHWLESGSDSGDTGRDIEDLLQLWAANLPRKDRLVLYGHWRVPRSGRDSSLSAALVKSISV